MRTAFLGLYHLLLLSGVGECAPTTAWSPPINNSTALQTETAPSWVQEPPGRGTLSLVYSCTFTTFLCVYTAIHLNLPPPNESLFRLYARKIKWVLIALIAPELVIFTAWTQWQNARAFMRGMEGLRQAAIKNEEPFEPNGHLRAENVPQTPYTMLDGFYAVMGGLAIDNVPNPKSRGTSRMTVSWLGWPCHVERTGKFLKVSHEVINDHSKAGVLGKVLVCLQVTWMVIQTAARTVEGYPLTLLEVHTVVHVACSLSLYALWFNKPVDICEPVVYDGTTGDGAELLAGSDHQAGEAVAVSSRTYLGRRAHNFDPYSFGGDRWYKSLKLWVFILLGLAYGGVHLSAWNFDFPTRTEQQLWKICCIVVMFGNAAALYSDRKFPFASVATAALVGAARLGITVEAFISLRKVPAGVYATVEWSQAIPHF